MLVIITMSNFKLCVPLVKKQEEIHKVVENCFDVGNYLSYGNADIDSNLLVLFQKLKKWYFTGHLMMHIIVISQLV